MPGDYKRVFSVHAGPTRRFEVIWWGLTLLHHRCRADGLDGLSQLAHDLQGAQVSQLLGMISAGHVAISHVSGSHQLGRVLHEVITFSIVGQRLLESCTL